MLQEHIGITNPFYPGGTFGQANVAAAQTDADLLTPGGVAHRTAVVRGHLAALEVNLSAAATAGSLTAKFTVNGTEVDDSAVVITTQTSRVVKFYERDNIRFAAGDTLGVSITTSADWDGTTAEVEAALHLALNGWDF